MPSIEETTLTQGPVLGHVNLMVDTLIANVEIADLRAIVRATLASSPPSIASAFTSAARTRLDKTNATATPDPACLFVQTSSGTASAWEPSAELDAVLRRTRAVYGSGMGLASLRILTKIVEGASRTRWEEDSVLEDRLAAIDADIAQALVSAGQEMDAERVGDDADPEGIRTALCDALEKCEVAVTAWGGEFPFERAVASVEKWKTDQKFAR